MFNVQNAAAQRYNYQTNPASTVVYIQFCLEFGILCGSCANGWLDLQCFFATIGGWQSYIKQTEKVTYGRQSVGFQTAEKYIIVMIVGIILEPNVCKNPLWTPAPNKKPWNSVVSRLSLCSNYISPQQVCGGMVCTVGALLLLCETVSAISHLLLSRG